MEKLNDRSYYERYDRRARRLRIASYYFLAVLSAVTAVVVFLALSK